MGRARDRASADLNGQEFILDADADTSISADTDDQIDIKIAGADDFQFTANTFTAQSGSTIAAQALTATTITTSSTVDVQGNEIILDDDGDTSITADTDDQIDIRISGADDFAFKANTFEVQTGSNIDMNGTELILDADGDTSITADTDDQIDVRISGADDFRFTANNMNVLSGSTLTIDSGATITNSGTASGFGITWNIGSAYNTNFTASAGNGYFVSTSGGAVTATLPASPSAGDEVRFIDLSATFDTNNLTIGRNSEKIMGDAADLTVATERAGLGLVYSDSTNGWLLIDK